MHLGPITTHFIRKMWPVFAGSTKISGCFFLAYCLGTHIKLILMYPPSVIVSTKFKNNELAYELVKVPIEW